MGMTDAKIVAAYKSDLEQATNWLRVNKMIQSTGEIKFDKSMSGVGMYVADLVLRSTKKDSQQLVSDRFGMFVKVI